MTHTSVALAVETMLGWPPASELGLSRPLGLWYPDQILHPPEVVDGPKGSRVVGSHLRLLDGAIGWLWLSARNCLPLLRGIPAEYESSKLCGLSSE